MRASAGPSRVAIRQLERDLRRRCLTIAPRILKPWTTSFMWLDRVDVLQVNAESAD